MPGCSAVIMGWSLERPQKPLCSLNYHDPGSAKASPCTPARVKRQVIESLVGTYPSPERVGLRVVAAKPSYMLAMKLSALERSTADDRDFADAVQLGIACGVNTVDGASRDLSERPAAGETMARPQTLAEVGRIAERSGRPTSPWRSDEFVDEFYLDHGDKVAQQQRLGTAPEPVGDPRIDAWIGAVGEHLALRWNLAVPAWTQRDLSLCTRAAGILTQLSRT